MRYVKGNANQGYSLAYNKKKRVHSSSSNIPEAPVSVRKMTEEDWIRFYENKKKRKK